MNDSSRRYRGQNLDKATRRALLRLAKKYVVADLELEALRRWASDQRRLRVEGRPLKGRIQAIRVQLERIERRLIAFVLNIPPGD